MYEGKGNQGADQVRREDDAAAVEHESDGREVAGGRYDRDAVGRESQWGGEGGKGGTL